MKVSSIFLTAAYFMQLAVASPVNIKPVPPQTTAIQNHTTNAVMSAKPPVSQGAIDFSKWDLQLPLSGTGKPGKMMTIPSEKISSYQEPGVFDKSGSKIAMTVDVNKVIKMGPGKSPNSQYYRTEFRQCKSAGAGFSLASTKPYTMDLTFSVDRLEGTGTSVVVAQIHGAGPLPNLEVKVKADGSIIAEDHKNAKGTDVKNSPRLTSSYKLGQKATLKIVAGMGKIDLFYNGARTPTASIKGAYKDQYFKAGSYCQNANPGAVCHVSVYGLALS